MAGAGRLRGEVFTLWPLWLVALAILSARPAWPQATAPARPVVAPSSLSSPSPSPSPSSSPTPASPGTRGTERSARSAADLMDAVMWNREPIGGPFRLIDHEGRERRDSDFRGKLMLVYFGFTQCPNVCPIDLQQIALALDELGEDARQIAPLFVTLDPQHDTVALLGQYVPAFHRDLIGLTGDSAAIGRIAEAYRVYHAKVPVPGRSGYTIDHSSFIYLLGRDGSYLGYLPPSTAARQIVQSLRPQLRR
jgi:cytochrome oxidase Cu insertion factor (SCO1/SenC/PrrC family)